jgi:PEP-CTERM motif
MTSIRKIVGCVAAVALLGAGLVGTAEASVISVIPSTQTIALGGTATVDIVLSGLAAGETVGAFSFLLGFNNSILGTPDSFVANPDNKMGAVPLDASPGFAAGGGSPLSVFYFADGVISEPALKALEGTGFRLATVAFTGLSEGSSPLTLSISPLAGVFLSDYSGLGVVPATAVNGSVCVDNPATPGNPCGPSAIPEPATLSLLVAGLGAVVARRRRRGGRGISPGGKA